MKHTRLTAGNVIRWISNVCSSICIVSFLLFANEISFAGSLIATWNPNNEADLAGYTISYGTESGQYSVEQDVGNSTVFVAEDLVDGEDYYFVVKAYDQAGNISDPSVEVSGRVGDPMLVSLLDEKARAIKLVWTPIVDAENYQIYKSNDPYFEPQLPVATVPKTTFQYVDSEHFTATESQTFYKVVAMAAGQPAFTFNTVGAYDVLLRRGLNLVSMPLIPADSTIHSIFGEQLTGGENASTADQLRIWNGEEYEIIWYYEGPVVQYKGKWVNSTTGLQSAKKLSNTQSFWVEIQTGHTDTLITFTGKVPTDSNTVITLKKGYNFVGSCYPVAVPLEETELYEDKVVKGGVGSGEADIVRAWTGITYDKAWVVDGTHTELDGVWMDETGKNKSTIQFIPGYGYIIWIKGENPQKTWSYPNPAFKN